MLITLKRTIIFIGAPALRTFRCSFHLYICIKPKAACAMLMHLPHAYVALEVHTKETKTLYFHSILFSFERFQLIKALKHYYEPPSIKGFI